MKVLKTLSALAVSAMMLFSVAAINVSAATTTQDGLEVTLTTDKETYTKDEKITATLSVKNTNKAAVNDVALETLILDGYELADNTANTKNLDKLAPNETAELSVVYEPKSSQVSEISEISEISEVSEVSEVSEISEVSQVIPSKDSPKTGDNAAIPVAVAILLLVSVLLAVFCFKGKKGRKLLSLILCVSSVYGYFVLVPTKVNAVDTVQKSLNITTSVKIETDDIFLNATVEYKIEVIENITKDVSYYEQLLGIDKDIDLSDNNGNYIPDSLEEELSIDSDNDGLPDLYEKIYETDPFSPDTDGDKLPDIYELMILGSSAVAFDTDNNGISDADEDFDQDGITNFTEYTLKTHPLIADTDKDGLSDYDEVYEYTTDPTKQDTDDDGLLDANEIKYGMNPHDPDTLKDNVLDGDRMFTVTVTGEESDNSKLKPELSVELSGKQIESLLCNKVSADDVFLNSDIPGYIGNAYDLSIDGDFSSATLKFEIDDSYFDDSNFNPVLYYWNEETQIFEEVANQTLSGNVITANLEHFSSYTVLSKNLYESSLLEFEIEAPAQEELQNKTFDVVLSLDESGSINYNDFVTMKNLCAEFIEKLSNDDKISIYTFDDAVRKHTDFINKDEAKEAVASISQNGGWTSIYDAIDMALEALSQQDDGSTKVIILLTDGRDNDSRKSFESVVEKTERSNTVIYPVGIGNSIDSDKLTRLAQAVGGKYYNSADFPELSIIFDRVISDADLYKDSDEDGISDYHEKCIANGKLKLGNGESLRNSNLMNYLSDDSDSDGLIDGEEFEIRERQVGEKTVYYGFINSNPCAIDTDFDELDDYFEIYAGLNPLSNESNSNDLFTRNTYNDWVELKKYFGWDKIKWNFIHDLVKNNIVLTHPFMRSEVYLEPKEKSVISKIKGSSRIDLLNTMLLEIWDVKPTSYQFSPNKEKGVAKLEEYIEKAKEPQNVLRYAPQGIDMSNLKVGGSFIKDGTIKIMDYTVEYENQMNGLIVYHFEKYNKLPQPAEAPADEPVVVEAPENAQQWSTWLWALWEKVGQDVGAFGDAVCDAISDFGTGVQNEVREILNNTDTLGAIGVTVAIVLITAVLVKAAITASAAAAVVVVL